MHEILTSKIYYNIFTRWSGVVVFTNETCKRHIAAMAVLRNENNWIILLYYFKIVLVQYAILGKHKNTIMALNNIYI